jgi:hypothetical protein
MKSTLTISVKEPCTEKFTNFSKTEKGGFCTNCQKEVIDFTKASNEELIRHFSKTSNKTCGVFKSSQLTSYEINSLPMIHNNIISKGIGMMTLSLLALCTTQINGQETADIETGIEVVSTETLGKIAIIETVQEYFLVKGTVLDETNEPLPGVNVVLKGSTIGIQTDIDGKYEFPQELEVNDVLVFSYIGYETKTYKVTASKSSTIDVNITFNTYDVELMGDIVIEGTYSSKRNVFQKFISIFK